LFLKDGRRFIPWLRGVTGSRVGPHLAEVLTRVWNTLGGFIRTQALVSLIDAVFIGAALLIVGVPLAIPLAILTFFGGFVPIVGAFVVGAVAVLVALVSNGVTGALIILAVILVVQQLEGNVLSPWLQSQSMNLHAAVVLLAVTLGSTIFGIIGAFLAVPTVAVVAVVLRYLDDIVASKSDPGPGTNADAEVGPGGGDGGEGAGSSEPAVRPDRARSVSSDDRG
jgi:predicted PurR-regulated permease PerM